MFFLGILGVHKKTKKHPTTWWLNCEHVEGFYFVCPVSYMGGYDMILAVEGDLKLTMMTV